MPWLQQRRSHKLRAQADIENRRPEALEAQRELVTIWSIIVAFSQVDFSFADQPFKGFHHRASLLP
jgi:hypothetical protein